MYILYLHTDIAADADIWEALSESGENVSDVIYSEDELDALAALIEEKRCEMVFCLCYFPAVSLLCKQFHIKYVAWIHAPYEASLYSCTMLNSCNSIFLSDKALYDEFAAEGFPHLYYLPLGVNARRIRECLSSRDTTQDETVDILMAQDIHGRDGLAASQLLSKAPLKDATRGYLEGCLACEHQLSGIPEMTSVFPAYIWEDLEQNLVCEKAGDSVESLAHRYESRIFHPIITDMDREDHLYSLALGDYFAQVELYTSHAGYHLDHVSCYHSSNLWQELPALSRRAKINLVITDRNLRSSIPQEAWDIMASGGFLLSNLQADYLDLLETLPALYVDRCELFEQARYYYDHPEERHANALALQAEVCERHTYAQRLRTLLDIVANGIEHYEGCL